ncbi:hypothetical protein HDU83_003945 [Entophlyctis luteolus]|nr:hypothetical protein HDU83_003945 [Entophlyctis luteolus]
MIGGGGEHDDSNADDDSDALDGVLNLPDAYGAFSTMDGSGSDAAVVTAALSYAMLLLPPIDLQRAARVSRQWHAAALRAAWLVLRPTSPGRLHRVLLYSLRADIQPFSLSNFDAFAWVKSLDFSHLHAHNAVTYTNFVILVNHCRAMVSLDLSMCAWVRLVRTLQDN